MNRQERRHRTQKKNDKRRHLYINYAINGRFEVSDQSVEVPAGYMNNKAFRSTLSPSHNYERLIAGEGYWSPYPKNKYYGSNGNTIKHKTKQDRIQEDRFDDILEMMTN